MPRGRPPKGSVAHKRLYASFDLDTSAMIRAWMEANGFEAGQENDAVTSLMRQALASTPREGALSAERMRVYHKTRYFVMERIVQAMFEIKGDLVRLMAEEPVDHENQS